MVAFLSFSPSGSNKTIKLPLQLIADGNGDRWKILIPKIDKLSITYDIPTNEHQVVKEMLWGLMKEGDLFSSAKASKANRYKTRAILTHPMTGREILIEVDPKAAKANVPFVRLEFNPDKLGPEGVSFVQQQLEAIFLGNHPWQAIATSGKVTRIDLALDLLNIPIDQLVVSSTKGGKSHCYYSAAGALETAYLEIKGKKAGPKVVYDKAQQLADAKRNPKFEGVPHTRIEVHVKTQRSIAKLGTLPNPFVGLDVSYPAFVGKPSGQEHHWNHFLDSVRYRGRDGALALIPDAATRNAYADALDAAQKAFWRPAKLWERWPAVLAASGLLGLS